MSFINVRLEQVGTGSTDWILLGTSGAGMGSDSVGVQLESSGTTTATVEVTLDPALNSPTGTVAAAQITAVAGLVGITAGGVFDVTGGIKAIRLTQTAGAGTSAITVLTK